MKVLVINAQRAKGISGRTGRDYDICTVTYCYPVEPVNNENRQVVGYGHNTNELSLDPAALSQFANYTYPIELDLIIEPDPRNVQRNICKGVNGK